MPSTAETAVPQDVGDNNYRSLNDLRMDGVGVFNFVQTEVPPMIDDLLDCTVVADYLALSPDTLALAVVQLGMRGLVQATPNRGLRITDVDALQALADEGPDPERRPALELLPDQVR
jgi:hypothetical protein